jgi:hypothetical protein
MLVTGSLLFLGAMFVARSAQRSRLCARLIRFSAQVIA